MTTILQAIDQAAGDLAAKNVPESRKEAEFLIATLLGLPRTRLYLDRKQSFPKDKSRRLRSWLYKRMQRMPLAYICGEQPFLDLTLQVSPSVLVPRPETELLVDYVRQQLETYRTPSTIIDVGTGSGNIALSLVDHPLAQRVIAIDRSPAALRMARRNERLQRLSHRMDWRHGDLLSSVGVQDLPVDVVVANLPYVRSADMKRLDPELYWEPRSALDGGHDGLRVIEPCMQQAAGLLRKGGVLFLEIGADQAQEVIRLGKQDGRWCKVMLFRDLSQKPRIIRCVRKG